MIVALLPTLLIFQDALAETKPSDLAAIEKSLQQPDIPLVRPFRVVCITKKSRAAPRKDCADGTTIISTGGALCPNELEITDISVQQVDENQPVKLQPTPDDVYKAYDTVRHCVYYVH